MNSASVPNTRQPGLVSIITPCYNAAPFVADTMECVSAQTGQQIEHIVIDDGSTDGSWELIEQYTQRITTLRLGQNRGGSYARNRGAELAHGDFLMFLDADDLIAPNTIDALVTAVRERPGCIAFCNWKLLRQVQGKWIELPAQVPLPMPGADQLRGWLLGSWVPPCAVLWRREVYEATGGWDETLSKNQDGDLMLRALAKGARLIAAQKGAAFYRSHSSARLSVSRNIFASEGVRSQMAVFEKLAAELDQQGQLTDYAEPLGIAYHHLATLAFQAHPELARECLRRGQAFAGHRAVSRTWVGRFLTRLAGVEQKERIAGVLARLGLMTSARRQVRNLRRLAEGRQKK